MILVECYVRFSSTLDLPTTANLLSGRLFGGVPFVDTDEFDEVPGMRLEQAFLALYATICGDGPTYGLQLHTSLVGIDPTQLAEQQYLDLGPYIEQLLAAIPGIRVIPT